MNNVDNNVSEEGNKVSPKRSRAHLLKVRPKWPEIEKINEIGQKHIKK